MSKYTTTRILISGYIDTIQRIHDVICDCNKNILDFWDYCEDNSAKTILSKLHVNTKNISELSRSTWWLDPFIDKKGRLVFTDYSWGGCSRFEELLKQKYGKSIINISYTFLDYS